MAGGVGDTFHGSVGTLVAAAMETAGMYLQSSSLDAINGLYGLALAAFFFLIGLVTAGGIFAVGGQYKFLRWFLIAPGLFFFVVSTRMNTYGSEWRFGSQARDSKLVQSMNDGVIEKMDPARVSWLYVQWDRMISGVVQGFVTVILSLKEEQERDMGRLMKKAEKFTALMTSNVEDNDVSLFLSKVLFARCAPYLLLQQKLAIMVDGEDTTDLMTAIEKQRGNAVMSSNDRDYSLVRRLVDREFITESQLPSTVDGVRTMTCDDLWKASVQVMRVWAESRFESVTKQEEKAILDKFRQTGQQSDEEAKRILLNTLSINALMRANRYYISTMGVEPQSAAKSRDLISLNEGKVGLDGYEKLHLNDELRYQNLNYENQSKGEYINSMLSMPYMQGFVLYFLSWIFPWFAFMLLLPGRHISFMHWFGLWFWVKTWDIGFAIVLLLDDLLFWLMPSGVNMTDETVENVQAALRLSLSADPTYSTSTYYTIMATLIGAVPVLSAFLVKSASGDIIAALSEGFSRFSKQVGVSFASHTRAAMAQRIISSAEQKKLAAGWKAYQEKMPMVERTVALASAGKGVLKQVMEKMVSQENFVLTKTSEQQRSEAATLGRGITDASVDAFGEWIVSRAKFSAKYAANKAMWDQAHSEENTKLERYARMMKYNSHDFLPKNVDATLTEDLSGAYNIGWAKGFKNLPYAASWNGAKL